jgi:hypothetical protein
VGRWEKDGSGFSGLSTLESRKKGGLFQNEGKIGEGIWGFLSKWGRTKVSVGARERKKKE